MIEVRQSPAVERSEMGLYYDTDPFPIVQPRGFGALQSFSLFLYSPLDARRKFAAETYLSARICNAADKVLDELQSFNLFLDASLGLHQSHKIYSVILSQSISVRSVAFLRWKPQRARRTVNDLLI